MNFNTRQAITNFPDLNLKYYGAVIHNAGDEFRKVEIYEVLETQQTLLFRTSQSAKGCKSSALWFANKTPEEWRTDSQVNPGYLFLPAQCEGERK